MIILLYLDGLRTHVSLSPPTPIDTYYFVLKYQWFHYGRGGGVWSTYALSGAVSYMVIQYLYFSFLFEASHPQKS